MAKVKAGEAYVRLSLDDELQAGLIKAGDQMKAFGKSVAVAGAALAGIGTAIVTPIVASAKAFADFGDNLDKVSARTGVAVESLSELGFATEQSGASIADLEKAIRGMQRGMFDAKRGAGEMLFALEELGLTYKDLENLSPEDQFQLLGDRLAGIENDSIRAAVSMKAFGKSGSALLPLFGNIKSLREEARALNITMDTDSAKSAAELTDSMNRLNRVFLAIKVSVGSAVAPLLSDLSTRLSFALGEVIKFIKSNQDLIVIALKLGTAIAVVGGALISIGGTIALLGFTFTGIASAIGIAGSVLTGFIGIIGAIVSPIGLVIVAITTLTSTILTYTEIGQTALNFYKKEFESFANYIAESVEFIGNAFAKGGIDLAIKALWATIKVEFLKGLVYVNGIWLELYENAIHAFNQIKYGAKNALEGMLQIIVKAAGFIGKSFWDGINVVIDAFKYLADAVVLILNAIGVVSDRTYDSITNGIRKAEQAGKKFTASQKQIIDDFYGGEFASSDERQKQNNEELSNKFKSVADKFQNANAGLGEELAKAQEEYSNVAKLVTETPKETKKAAVELKKGIKATVQQAETTTGSSSSAGAFSSAAARGLDSAGINRVAKATEQTAKNTEKLVNRGQLTFT